MLRRLTVLLTTMLWLAASAQPTTATTAVEPTRLLVILDCSNSMWEHWQSDAKIKVTQQVLLKFIDTISTRYPKTEMALRVFGHLNKEAYGTRLEVPFGKNNTYKLQSKIKTLVPQGGCSVASALTHSLNDFPQTEGSRNIILVLTDGIDDCEGNICQVAAQIENSGALVQTFIIAIGSSAGKRPPCAVHYSHVKDEENLFNTLSTTYRRATATASLTPRLLSPEGTPIETALPYSLIDQHSGRSRYNAIYINNGQQHPHTLTIDPLITYRLKLHTTPPIEVAPLTIAANDTVEIPITLAQGTLSLHFTTTRTAFPLPTTTIEILSQEGSATIGTQQMGQTGSLIAGTYNLRILTTPPITLNNIAINHASNTDLAIPTPGQLTIQKQRGATQGWLMHLNNGSPTPICPLNGNQTTENHTLQPGNYIIMINPVKDNTPAQTKTVKIQSAKQTTITF